MKKLKFIITQNQILELTSVQLKRFKELTGIKTKEILGFDAMGVINLLDELNPDALISLVFGQGRYEIYIDDGHDDIKKSSGDNAADALWEALKTML
jgi:hypothetical protein